MGNVPWPGSKNIPNPCRNCWTRLFTPTHQHSFRILNGLSTYWCHVSIPETSIWFQPIPYRGGKFPISIRFPSNFQRLRQRRFAPSPEGRTWLVIPRKGAVPHGGGSMVQLASRSQPTSGSIHHHRFIVIFISIHIYTYLYISISIHIYTVSVHIYIYPHMHVCIYTCIQFILGKRGLLADDSWPLCTE